MSATCICMPGEKAVSSIHQDLTIVINILSILPFRTFDKTSLIVKKYLFEIPVLINIITIVLFCKTFMHLTFFCLGFKYLICLTFSCKCNTAVLQLLQYMTTWLEIWDGKYSIFEHS